MASKSSPGKVSPADARSTVPMAQMRQEQHASAGSAATLESAAQDYRTPAFPPKMNFDDKLKSLDEVPLFMRDLPTAEREVGRGKGKGIDIESNTALEALQNLAFEGTPDEIAENFKSQGNDYFKGKRYREAVGFYTQAIDAKPTDSTILQSCYLNRAACNLELKNYGQTIRDTSQVLAINPKSEKAYWRAARALFATDKVVDALDCCKRGLKINPENKDFAALETKIEKRKEEVDRREVEKKELERRKKEMDLALKRALLARGVWIESMRLTAIEGPEVHFHPEALPEHSKPDIPLSGLKASTWQAPDPIRTPLVLPVLNLYPQYRQSDMIPGFPEDNPIGAYLEELFPAKGSDPAQFQPWDIDCEYYGSNLNVYASTHKKRLLKIGKKLTLREFLDQGAKDPEKGAERDGFVMSDGFLTLIVLPRGSMAEKIWIENFKKEREASAK